MECQTNIFSVSYTDSLLYLQMWKLQKANCTIYIRDLSIQELGITEDPGTNPLLDRDKGKHATVHIYNDKEKYSKLYLSEKSNFQQQP